MKSNKKLRYLIREIIEEELDEITTSDSAGAYDSKYAFEPAKEETYTQLGYELAKREPGLYEMAKRIKERSYKDFKNDPGSTQKIKINKAIHEINGKLYRVESLLRQSVKFKNESGIDGGKFWESTKTKIRKIDEKINKIMGLSKQLGN